MEDEDITIYINNDKNIINKNKEIIQNLSEEDLFKEVIQTKFRKYKSEIYINCLFYGFFIKKNTNLENFIVKLNWNEIIIKY